MRRLLLTLLYRLRPGWAVVQYDIFDSDPDHLHFLGSDRIDLRPGHRCVYIDDRNITGGIRVTAAFRLLPVGVP